MVNDFITKGKEQSSLESQRIGACVICLHVVQTGNSFVQIKPELHPDGYYGYAVHIVLVQSEIAQSEVPAALVPASIFPVVFNALRRQDDWNIWRLAPPRWTVDRGERRDLLIHLAEIIRGVARVKPESPLAYGAVEIRW